jgi:hypothetical protein
LASISQTGSQASSGFNNNNDAKMFDDKDNGSATYNFALAASKSVNPQRLANGSTISLAAPGSADALALQSRLGGVEVALNPLNPRSRSQVPIL